MTTGRGFVYDSPQPPPRTGNGGRTTLSEDESWAARNTRWMNAVHARAATLSRPATAFTTTPEPRTIGSFARGRQITGGNFLFAGFLVQAPDTTIWDLPMPDDGFEAELHRFAWLDDLAAVGDVHATKRAQEWTHEWVARFGRGKGHGWTPDLTGLRLIRWISLLSDSREFCRSSNCC